MQASRGREILLRTLYNWRLVGDPFPVSPGFSMLDLMLDTIESNSEYASS